MIGNYNKSVLYSKIVTESIQGLIGSRLMLFNRIGATDETQP